MGGREGVLKELGKDDLDAELNIKRMTLNTMRMTMMITEVFKQKKALENPLT